MKVLDQNDTSIMYQRYRINDPMIIEGMILAIQNVFTWSNHTNFYTSVMYQWSGNDVSTSLKVQFYSYSLSKMDSLDQKIQAITQSRRASHTITLAQAHCSYTDLQLSVARRIGEQTRPSLTANHHSYSAGSNPW